jgi:hypothetical protein
MGTIWSSSPWTIRVGTSIRWQVLGQVGLGEGLAAVIGPLEPDLHAGPVGAIEGLAEVLVELGVPLGLASVLSISGGDGAQQHDLGDPVAAVAADIAGDLAAQPGPADRSKMRHGSSFHPRPVGVAVRAMSGNQTSLNSANQAVKQTLSVTRWG